MKMKMKINFLSTLSLINYKIKDYENDYVVKASAWTLSDKDQNFLVDNLTLQILFDLLVKSYVLKLKIIIVDVDGSLNKQWDITNKIVHKMNNTFKEMNKNIALNHSLGSPIYRGIIGEFAGHVLR